MSPARFRWGIILILIGLLVFFRNINLLHDDFWSNLILFLPILLIAIGIEKIFSKTKLQMISYASSVAILVGGLAVAFAGNYGERAGSFFSESQVTKMHDENVKRIAAEIDVDETALTIRDSGDDIVYATFDRFTRKPDVKYEIVGEQAELKLSGHGSDMWGGIVRIENDNQQEWMVSFSKSIPLDFVCKGDQADVHLNLATTPLENLVLDMHDSFIYLKMGDLVPRVHVKISGEDSKLKLRIPENVGLKIMAEGYDSFFEKIGMHRNDSWFVKDGNDTLKSQVEINLDAQLIDFSIDYF